MEYDQYGDISISGSGKTGGGVFNRMHISGSGKISGDIECADFHISGSCQVLGSLKAQTGQISGSTHIDGAADFARNVSVSGSLHVDDHIDSGELSVSGSLHVGRDMQAEKAAVSGSLHVGGKLTANEMRVSGELEVQGDCSAESFRSDGSLHIEGLLNAGTVTLRLRPFHNQVKEIGGGTIRVETAHQILGQLLRPFVGSGFILTTDTVEGDEIYLENTRANVVRGKRVTIGKGCEIGLVEYGESLTKDDDAAVKESRKR